MNSHTNKTHGQLLYERLNPKFITVYADRTPWASPMVVENPKFVVPWYAITQRCKDSYESQAKGHHLVPESHRAVAE